MSDIVERLNAINELTHTATARAAAAEILALGKRVAGLEGAMNTVINRLKPAFHNSTFLQGQNTPCAVNLFKGFDDGIRIASAALKGTTDA